ncbi:MAG: hypothetical protein ABI597_12345 [Gammaproteobacteria bacterium]
MQNQRGIIPSLYVSEEETNQFFNAVFEKNAKGEFGLKKQYTFSQLTQDANTNFNEVYDEYISNTAGSRDESLANSHKNLFARESYLENVKGLGPVRIFPPKDKNILIDVDDLFRNALGFFRATQTIINEQKMAASDKSNAQKESAQLFKSFCEIMQIYKEEYQKVSMTDPGSAEKILIKANKKLAEFNGALANQLVDLEICRKFKHAQKAINLVRGYQFKMTYPEMHCTVIDQPGIAKTLYFSKPTTFTSTRNDPTSPWHDLQSQSWYKHLREKTGRPGKKVPWYAKLFGLKQKPEKPEEGYWFDNFFKHHPELDTLSGVPMERSTPNTANCNESTTAVFDHNGTLLQRLTASRAAITEPYETSEKDKAALTLFNHKQLLSESRIQQLVANHCMQWNSLYTTNATIQIPYLHQTLITDGVIGAGDSGKSSTMLDNKARANEALRKELLGKEIFVSKHAPFNVIVINKGEYAKQPLSGTHRKVELKILATNNCVNSHEKRSRVRNNDVNDSRELVRLASKQLQAIQVYSENNFESANYDVHQNFITIIRFLNSPNHSVFNPYKPRGDDVKTAIKEFSEFFRNQKDPKNLAFARDCGLVLQAAVELKCTVHETWFGSLRRNISNALLRIPYIGRGLKILIVEPLALIGKIASLAVPMAGWVGLGRWARHQGTRRKALYKSACEGILTGKLGAVEFGCMSNEDRGGETAALERAMLTQFSTTGKLIGFNDGPNDKRAFLETYCQTTEDEHNNAKMTTDSAIIKSAETRNPILSSGLLSEQETSEELDVSEMLDETRKGKFNKKTTIQGFIKSTTEELSKPEVEAQVADEKQSLLSDHKSDEVGIFRSLSGKDQAHSAKALAANGTKLAAEKVPDTQEGIKSKKTVKKVKFDLPDETDADDEDASPKHNYKFS